MKHLAPSINDLLDEEALIKEARVLSRRRRLHRGLIVITLVAVACLIGVGVYHFSSAVRSTSKNDPAALTCPSARVKMLGVTGLNGAAVDAGVLVRVSVSSSVTCTMSGYPIVGAVLTSHSTAMASDVRDTYLGGGVTTAAPLPRLSITSTARVVSFTIQFVTGNGATCPRVNAIKVTLPGSREVLTTDPIFNARGLALPMKFIYCGHLQVTPLVKGSSGKGS